jgi:hypothetical protein
LSLDSASPAALTATAAHDGATDGPVGNERERAAGNIRGIEAGRAEEDRAHSVDFASALFDIASI